MGGSVTRGGATSGRDFDMAGKLLITGPNGMVGRALVRAAQARGGRELLTPGRGQLDLLDQAAVHGYLREKRPEVVVVAAAKVGGIHANDTYPAEFIYENLMIAANLVEGSYRAGVGRLLFLGSSCIYPKFAPQPMGEGCLLTGELEPTNEAYAVAKIAGLKLCEYYRKQYGVVYHSAMPTNLYGPGDNYHAHNSHVIPGLIRRFHEAKESGAARVSIWGSGTPRREFLHVDDLAQACLHLLDLESPPDRVNVGSGEDIAIIELAQMVARTVGFAGEIATDPSKPDGTPRKLLDIGRISATGWRPAIGLAEGLAGAYADFLASLGTAGARL